MFFLLKYYQFQNFSIVRWDITLYEENSKILKKIIFWLNNYSAVIHVCLFVNIKFEFSLVYTVTEVDKFYASLNSTNF